MKYMRVLEETMRTQVPIFFLLAAFTPSISAQLQCYVPGEVIGGTIIGYSNTASYNECRSFCRADSECQFFTFFGDQPQAGCVTYSSCDTIEGLCTNCFSGERDCPIAQPVCEASGFCDRTSVDVPPADTESACQKACYETENCQWYSFIPSLGRCFLTSNCIKVEDCNDGCTHGEKDCYLHQDENFQKLVLVSGYTQTELTFGVEIVDLSGRNETCSELPSYPIAIPDAVGTYMDKRIIVCGGYLNGTFIEDCYYLEKGAANWTQDTSLSFARQGAAAVKLSLTEWWITGGSGVVSSTEIKMHGVFPNKNYTSLPAAVKFHNLVKINDTHFILTGGADSTDEVWILNKEKEEWSQLTNIPTRLQYLQAGLVQYTNGSMQLVVVDGYRTSECFGLDLDTLEWTQLKTFGVDTSFGNVVQYGNTFLLVGGRYGGEDIFMYDPDIAEWVVLPQQLMIPHQSAAGFLVPDDFLECSLGNKS